MKTTILDGIGFLQNHDEEMFRRFTEEQRLFICYTHDITITNLYEYFHGMNEMYIKRGAQGIACFIIQSLLLSEASPSINRFRLTESENSALKNVPRKVMERMLQHSFDPDLINSYSNVVKNWERKERFR